MQRVNLLRLGLPALLLSSAVACSDEDLPVGKDLSDGSIDSGTPGQDAAQDVTSEKNCGPAVYYGMLAVCATDEQCVEELGPGAWCDKSAGYDDPCQGWVSQASCKTGSLDSGTPDVQPDCQPMAYYGPMPCSTDEQCVEANGPGWVCDTEAGFEDSCSGWVSWPACIPDVDAGDAGDAALDCQPMAYYGPMPCDSDQDCVDAYGAGYTCDTDNGFEDPCAGWISWPSCNAPVDGGTPEDAALDCQPMVYYGPMPCGSDQDCVDVYGAGYTCDPNYGFEDPCSGWVSWPACMPPVDGGTPSDAALDCQPMAYYGPMPCDSEQDCVDAYGAGYTCDMNYGFEDPCAGWVSWPACIPDSIDGGVPDAVDETPAGWYGPLPDAGSR